MRGPCRFKKSDVTKAAKAVLAAGLSVARIEVSHNGSITIVPGQPAESVQTDETPADLQKLI
jgi:hypothetical protein